MPQPTYFFSASTGGLYHSAIHAFAPDDAVKITEAQYLKLLDGMAAGKRVEASPAGRPQLVTPDAPPLAQRRAQMVARIKAEAARRIEELAPLWRQLNAVRAGDAALFAQVDAIRTRSDLMEAQVARLKSAELDAFDPAQDARWL